MSDQMLRSPTYLPIDYLWTFRAPWLMINLLSTVWHKCKVSKPIMSASYPCHVCAIAQE